MKKIFLLIFSSSILLSCSSDEEMTSLESSIKLEKSIAQQEKNHKTDKIMGTECRPEYLSEINVTTNGSASVVPIYWNAFANGNDPLSYDPYREDYPLVVIEITYENNPNNFQREFTFNDGHHNMHISRGNAEIFIQYVNETVYGSYDGRSCGPYHYINTFFIDD